MRGVPDLKMHIYGRGKHGGSMGPRAGIPFGTWPDRFIDWFRDLGFLEKPGVETQAAKDVADFAKRSSGRSGRAGTDSPFVSGDCGLALRCQTLGPKRRVGLQESCLRVSWTTRCELLGKWIQADHLGRLV